VLLAALALLLVCVGLVHLVAADWHPRLVGATVTGFFVVVLLSAVFAATQSRKSVTVALALVLPAIVLNGLNQVPGLDSRIWIEAAGEIFNACSLIYAVALILRFLFVSERVNLNVISASLCAYLLLGLTWASLFCLVAVFEPGSFALGSSPDGTPAVMQWGNKATIVPIYFSFVTLTTLGYGDMAPISPTARSLAIVEATVGQIYLAVLVARLVGLHVAHSASRRDY
jgi:hypothetical protein